MLRLIGDDADVPSVEEFMSRYKVGCMDFTWNFETHSFCLNSMIWMDHPAALHGIRIGVPATVEYSSEAG